MTDPYYVLNVNDGIDTVHRNPREKCNVDDAKGRQTVDEETAHAVLAMKEAIRCQHCWTETEDPA
jgi:hypothetical protein